MRKKSLSVILIIAVAMTGVIALGTGAVAAPGDLLLTSADVLGAAGIGGDSTYPSISSDGRYVAFQSKATNLPEGGGGIYQVYRKDLTTNAIVLASATADGDVGIGGDSTYPSISSDGRYVAFQSKATNFHPPSILNQVYRKDLSTGVTGPLVLASATAGGDAGTGVGSWDASISSDGRYVSFEANTTNLPGGVGGIDQVYRKDLTTGETGPILLASATSPEGDAGIGGNSVFPSISFDGRYVAFHSSATNLPSANFRFQVYRKDLSTGVTGPLVLASATSPEGAAGTVGDSQWPSISSDGRYVSFASAATNFPLANGKWQVYRKDLTTGETGPILLASATAGGDAGTGGNSWYPSISSDGTYVSFQSLATNFHPPNILNQVYRKEVGESSPPPPGPTPPTPAPLPGPATTTVTVNGVVPASGPPGTLVTITGTGFGSSQGSGGMKAAASSYVSFNGVKATEYTKWSDAEIICRVPSGAASGPVTVVVNGRSSSAAGATTFTVASPTWYLAEGSTAWGFSTYITIENPNESGVTARLTYMNPEAPSGKGVVATRDIKLPTASQTSVDPRWDLNFDTDFSTKVECLGGKTIAVDRTMYWTGKGAASPEAHSSVGVTAPAKTWYLPEGSSAWGFECWTLVQNPNSKEANVRLTYMIEGAGPRTFEKKVAPYSRDTFNMADDIGAADASIKVTSNVPVIPERSIYRNNRREGHCSIGTTAPSNNFYLAEGSTTNSTTTFILVQNPNPKASDITLTYMKSPSGTVTQTIKGMPANSRKTVNVGKDVPGMAKVDFSTKVNGTLPIIAERAMYWGAGTPLGEACHDSIGMSSAHKSFYLPDGQTSEGRQTYTLVMNPNASDVKVEISYLTPTGTGNVTRTETISKNSRKTFNMADAGIKGRAAIEVTCKTSGKKIMVERSMYWNKRGAGTNTIGGYSD